jgi:DNA-binding transcriptional MerR regulator
MLKLNFWISELAQLTGVSTRTIRYYIEEGLLPQPEVQGKYAVFNEDYLIHLRLIKHLKDAYLPLREIKRQLDNLMVPEIRELVKKFDENPSQTLAEMGIYPADKAKAMAIDISENEPQYDSAKEYIARALNRKPAVMREPQNTVPAPSPGVLHKYNSSTESWQRVELAPGVELNVRQPQPSYRRIQIEELISFARRIFKREDSK